MTAMKAAERLDQRNDLLLIIQSIDAELESIATKPGVKTLRDAQVARDSLQHRAELCRELQGLGFSPPALADATDMRDGADVIPFTPRKVKS